MMMMAVTGRPESGGSIRAGSGIVPPGFHPSPSRCTARTTRAVLSDTCSAAETHVALC